MSDLPANTLLKPAVSAYNEWDPLEEVIVGIADGACLPSWHVSLRATMPPTHWPMLERDGGKPFPLEVVAAANRDLDKFVRILEAEGVTVRRPTASTMDTQTPERIASLHDPSQSGNSFDSNHRQGGVQAAASV